MQQRLIAFYGDDFTGSTDAMESLARAGLRTVLLLQLPSEELLPRLDGVQAIGLAGTTRALAPDAMERALRPDLEFLGNLGAPVVHYKVCSTFDSSPEVGSIGRAIDVGRSVFDTPCVPVAVGAPPLGRFVAFGNLFARAGGDPVVHRLDRHPVMSRHPVTPMDESDLRLHLSRQTSLKIGLVDLLQLGTAEAAATALRAQRDAGAEIVVLDTVSEADMLSVGRLLWNEAIAGEPSRPLFVVGSSGVGYALTSHWRREGICPSPEAETDRSDGPGPVDQILGVSGSCSPVTAAQIDLAVSQGYAEVALDPTRLIDPDTRRSEMASLQETALRLLAGTRGVILHTCKGPDDPRVGATRAALAAQTRKDAERDDEAASARILGSALGELLVRLEHATGIRRAVVAGGDTSGYAAHVMQIKALEMIRPLSPGAPLCKAIAPGSALDSLEVVFKGGQLGGPDVFERVRSAR